MATPMSLRFTPSLLSRLRHRAQAMVVGRWHGRFVHIPIPVATGGRNQVDPNGDLWMSVLEATGQPARFS